MLWIQNMCDLRFWRKGIGNGRRLILTTPEWAPGRHWYLHPLPKENTPHNGLYREASLERGTLFRLQVNHERVGKLGKSVIQVCKGALWFKYFEQTHLVVV